jgi:hypothetical protein
LIIFGLEYDPFSPLFDPSKAETTGSPLPVSGLEPNDISSGMRLLEETAVGLGDVCISFGGVVAIFGS